MNVVRSLKLAIFASTALIYALPALAFDQYLIDLGRRLPPLRRDSSRQAL